MANDSDSESIDEAQLQAILDEDDDNLCSSDESSDSSGFQETAEMVLEANGHNSDDRPRAQSFSMNYAQKKGIGLVFDLGGSFTAMENKEVIQILEEEDSSDSYGSPRENEGELAQKAPKLQTAISKNELDLIDMMIEEEAKGKDNDSSSRLLLEESRLCKY